VEISDIKVEVCQGTKMPCVDITRVCPKCGEPSYLKKVPTEGFMAWQAGASVQRALPDLTVDQREVLMTGYHSECFDLDTVEDDPYDELLTDEE
jgi:hypothetical protein